MTRTLEEAAAELAVTTADYDAAGKLMDILRKPWRESQLIELFARHRIANPSPLDREAIIRECAAVVFPVVMEHMVLSSLPNANIHNRAVQKTGSAAKAAILALIEQAGGE